MPHAYSLVLRKRVLTDCEQGMTSENVARKYSVSISWGYDLRKRLRETGNIASKQYKRRQKQKHEPYEQEVRQFVADHPDAPSSNFMPCCPKKMMSPP